MFNGLELYAYLDSFYLIKIYQFDSYKQIALELN